MNIYLCSTVRHLLFSLLKALSSPNQKHTVFMISDQQNIDAQQFDQSVLPENLQVQFVLRQQIRQTFYSGTRGKIIKLMANFNVSTTHQQQNKIAVQLFNQNFYLCMNKIELESRELFLFNDRNKMSRLFRLAFCEYTLIEEGLANYGSIKLKTIEKAAAFFSSNKRKMRYFGDDKRCKAIYLINPEKAPSALQKKVKNINFIKAENIRDYCKAFFKSPEIDNYDCILATQPLAHSKVDMQIYQKIINACLAHNLSIAIKPHPCESITRYQEKIPNIVLINAKLPLEVVLFGTPQKTTVLSIYSTAGIGFEKYCQRECVIKDHESDKIPQLFHDWQQDITSVEPRIAIQLQNIINA
jgi:hypothetical protein